MTNYCPYFWCDL